MEIRTPVTTVEVDMTCDACKVGKMRPASTNLCSLQQQVVFYTHCCAKCGSKKTFKVQYPHISYVPIPKKDDQNDPPMV